MEKGRELELGGGGINQIKELFIGKDKELYSIGSMGLVYLPT